MLPKDLLSKIPSVDEILDHPKVRETAEAVGHSAIATRVRTALADLGAEVARRAEPWRDTTPSELVDRLVQSLSPTRQSSSGELINATGLWRLEPPVSAPLPESARLELESSLGHFQTLSTNPQEQVASELAKLAGTERGAIATSYTTAHTALFAAIASAAEGSQQGQLVVGRDAIAHLEPGRSLVDLASKQGLVIHEVGGTDGASDDEYAAAIAQASDLGPVLVMAPEERVSSVARMAHRHHAKCAAALGDLLPVVPAGYPALGDASAARALANGADAVLLRGDGLTCGPAVGLVVGKATLLEACQKGLARYHWQADPLQLRLLASTLALFNEPERLRFTHPALALCDTPLENLRTRAERLAEQLGASHTIAAAEATELPPQSIVAGLPAQSSWGVRLHAHENNTDQLAQQLAHPQQAPQATVQVFARRDESGLIVDLRTVAPSQEASLLERLEA